MSTSRIQSFEDDDHASWKASAPSEPVPAVLSAVKEDIRQTLRSPWIDPALEMTARHPVFFTAAWSAIRPNVGKSFLALAKSIRSEATQAVRSTLPSVDLRKELEGSLSDEELHRVDEAARASHLGMAKSQIVVHALHRAAKRERIGGTGGEEPPIRRGVPEWQRWMSFPSAPDDSRPMLDEVVAAFQLPSAPVPLRLFARWPHALASVWTPLRPLWGSEAWNGAAARLRRLVLAGMATLPHPIELQWGALKARGFTDDERKELVERLAAFDAAMPGQTLMAAFAWASLGAPDIGSEG